MQNIHVLLFLAVPICTVCTENLSYNFFSKRKSSEDHVFSVLADSVKKLKLIVLLPNKFPRSTLTEKP